MTLAPAQPSSPNSKIGEVISIVDHTQIEVPVVESNEPPKLFKVGSQSGSCYKTITGTEGYVCPLTLTKDNWSMEGLRHATCNDKFEVTQEANSLTVKRVDSRGRDCHGWGMQLQFHCTKAVVEQAPTTSSSSAASATQGSVTVSLPQIVKTALHIRQEKKACMDDWNYCASVGFLANASHKICKDSKGQWKGSCTMRDCSNMHYECQKAAEDLNILPREIQEKSVQEREDEFWANFDWDF